MLTLKTVNAAIAAKGIAAELVQGEGYLYFVGDAVDGAYTTSVAVCRLNHLTLDQWLAELKKIMGGKWPMSQIETEYSVKWAAENPALFAASFNKFFDDYAADYTITSHVRPGFITLIAKVVDIGK